jgi:transcriptional regulator with XRE-family HTH domain
MNPPSPVVAAHELGGRLRERRETLGLPAADVAAAAQCTPQFLSQVEKGKKIPAVDKLTAMMGLLEFDAGEQDEMVELRARATQRGPLAGYGGLFSAELLRFFGFEHGCESMQSYSTGLVHGLLQTAEYAHAVFRSGGARIRQAEVERRVEARMVRQQRLTGPEPLALSAVMSEAALRQQVGGRRVMARQLTHLIERIEELGPHLQVRIIPFTSPGHPMLGTPNFHILGFASTRLSELVWLDLVPGVHLVDDPIAVHEYRVGHAGAVDAALDPVDSLVLIKAAAQELA